MSIMGKVVIPKKGFLVIEEEPWTREEIVACLRSNLSYRLIFGTWGSRDE